MTQADAPAVYGEMLLDLGAGRGPEAGEKAAALVRWMQSGPGGWPPWLTHKRIANICAVYTDHRKRKETPA